MSGYKHAFSRNLLVVIFIGMVLVVIFLLLKGY